MNKGYIKLHRETQDKALWHDKTAWRIFEWILMNVDYTTGSGSFGSYQIAQGTDINRNTVKSALQRLKRGGQLQLTSQSNHAYTTISVLSWAKYQGLDDSTTTKHPRITTIKEIKNILDKSNIGDKPPGAGKDGKYGNDQVNLILTRFEEHLGYKPSDRSPRNVAHNTRQLITSFIKNYGSAYEVVNGRELTFDYVLDKAWENYLLKDYAQSTEKLETFKLKMKTFLELQEKKITKEVIQRDFESERTILNRQTEDENRGTRAGTNSSSVDTFQDVAIIDSTIN